jgi:hypothetical protein
MPEDTVLTFTEHNSEALIGAIDEAVTSTPVFDIHTHLSPPEFGELCLWGIDELVRYHYLIAELFRSSKIKPSEYWALTKEQQADIIWETLFVRNTPISEAARGVVCVLSALGLDPAAEDLTEAREYFASVDLDEHITNVLDIANVSDVVMTNDPFHPVEAGVWGSNAHTDKRFHAALRMDPLINDWESVAKRQNFKDAASARKFLDEWIQRMNPLYMAVSLSHDFRYPDESSRSMVLRDVVLPTAKAHDLPFAMMIGVKRQINPVLGDAGDGVGRADLSSLEYICRENPDHRFMTTVLSRENQHELCVIARKFANLTPFGCWWFLNNPSVIAEITSERMEMLGASFIPQHSDCRILEQLIYKWAHSRRVIADVLFNQYMELTLDRYPLTPDHIQRDVQRMYSDNFKNLIHLPQRDRRP